MRAFLVALAVLCVSACDDAIPTAPIVPLDQQFTLAPGGSAIVEGSNTRVQFVQVSGDSRCPADALCIWAGDAIVGIRVIDAGPSSAYELHTGDSRLAEVTHRDFRIELLQLQPYPFSNRVIEASDYRATLQVRR